jgi:hypothetical protein
METTPDSNRRLVTGAFPDRESAERAFSHVSARGYDKGEVSVVMSDETRKKYFTSEGTLETELGSKAAEGVGAGAAMGGVLGAIVGAIAAVGTSIAIPGLGLVIAGPIAGALAGAGAGGVAGGGVGALIGWGVPEERVKQYEGHIDEGGIVMGVTPRNAEDAEFLASAWARERARDIHR